MEKAEIEGIREKYKNAKYQYELADCAQKIPDLLAHIDQLEGELAKVKDELDDRYRCPECGYTFRNEDDSRLEGMIEDRDRE